jgi:hypothetical protein
MPIDADRERRIIEDRPPFFASWTPVYALVLGLLGFLVVLLHLFTLRYR